MMVYEGVCCGVMIIVVCLVFDSLVMVLVCFNCYNVSNDIFVESGVFVLNMFVVYYKGLVDVFVGFVKFLVEECFVMGEWDELVIGVLILKDLIVIYDCCIVDMKFVLIYNIFFGEVVGLCFGFKD